MSQANVEVVRQIYAALSRGDIDGALDAGVSDIENDWSRSIGPYRGVYRGIDEARTLWTAFIEAVDELTFEVEEARDAGPHVVAFVRVHIRGRGSGAEAVAKLHFPGLDPAARVFAPPFWMPGQARHDRTAAMRR